MMSLNGFRGTAFHLGEPKYSVWHNNLSLKIYVSVTDEGDSHTRPANESRVIFSSPDGFGKNTLLSRRDNPAQPRCGIGRGCHVGRRSRCNTLYLARCARSVAGETPAPRAGSPAKKERIAPFFHMASPPATAVCGRLWQRERRG